MTSKLTINLASLLLVCIFKKDLWASQLFVPGIVKQWPVAKLFTAVVQQFTDTEGYLNQIFHPCFVWKCYSQVQHLPIFLFQDHQSVSKKECYRRILGKHPSGWPGCLKSHARGSFSFSWLWLWFSSKHLQFVVSVFTYSTPVETHLHFNVCIKILLSLLY